jgi:hypothetical protein
VVGDQQLAGVTLRGAAPTDSESLDIFSLLLVSMTRNYLALQGI